MNININYLGSKENLLDFIEKTIAKDANIYDIKFTDLFAGSGAVARHFRKKGFKVIANDIEVISFLSLKVLIEQNKKNSFWIFGGINKVFHKLNNIKPKKGFFYNNFSPAENKYCRKYFTIENASLIDAIRLKIKFWKKWMLISQNEEQYLLFCLAKAVEKVSNTAAIYEAYLKNFKKSAQKKIELIPIEINNNYPAGKIYNEPAEELIFKISGDILYLDPPYNRRQFSSNYHILNTLILYDSPQLKGKTGNRMDNFKSGWCLKTKAKKELEYIVKNAKFKKIYLSYNSEGIISLEEIKKIFKKYGKYKMYKKQYKRFKSNKNNGQKFIYEYIHICLKENNEH